MSHISLVQTLVKASGKKSTTVFFFPKLPLNCTSATPDAVFDLSLKSGAFDPTGIAIPSVVLSFSAFRQAAIGAGRESVKRRRAALISPDPDFSPRMNMNPHELGFGIFIPVF